MQENKKMDPRGGGASIGMNPVSCRSLIHLERVLLCSQVGTKDVPPMVKEAVGN